MKRFCPLLLSLGFLVLTGCLQTPVPDNREAETKALRDGEVASFIRDWGGKDADRMAAHFADHGNLIIPNLPITTGRESIAAAMKGALSDPNWSLLMQPVHVEVSRSGDLAYTRGTYVLTATDPATNKAVTEKGRFVTVFRKQADGAWKAVEDINNPEAPATSK